MANVYPKKLQFLLADAVRQEDGGKLTVLGLYTGEDVLLKEPLPKTLPEGIKGLALPGLTILATARDGHGSFNFSCELYGPDGKSLGKDIVGVKLEKQKVAPASLLVPVQPFPIPRFGTYRAVFKLSQHEYEFKFRVGHVDPKAVFPSVKTTKGQTNAKPTASKKTAKPKKVAATRHRGKS